MSKWSKKNGSILLLSASVLFGMAVCNQFSSEEPKTPGTTSTTSLSSTSTTTPAVSSSIPGTAPTVVPSGTPNR